MTRIHRESRRGICLIWQSVMTTCSMGIRDSLRNTQITVINFTNKVALYNFLSTFSGTHYVSPRTITAQIGSTFSSTGVSS